MRPCQFAPKGKLSWCCTPENNDVEANGGGFINLHNSCASSECSCRHHIDQENRDHTASPPYTEQCACRGPVAAGQRAAKEAAQAAAAEAARLAARRPRHLRVVADPLSPTPPKERTTPTPLRPRDSAPADGGTGPVVDRVRRGLVRPGDR